jgi:hypothetical protein
MQILLVTTQKTVHMIQTQLDQELDVLYCLQDVQSRGSADCNQKSLCQRQKQST